jgi:D-alanyl-D-alanine carboxypeptidase
VKRSERRFYAKLYTVIVLCGLIVAGLLVLTLSGGAQRIRSTAANSGSNTASAMASASANASTVSTAAATAVPTAVPTPTAAPTPTATPDTTSDDSLLKIVNRTSRLDQNYVPEDLVQVDVASSHTIYLRSEAASALEEMFSAAEDDGVNLVLISGYRSYEDETELYNYYVNLYGKDHADIIDDMPGASEHQLGLAVDLGTSDGTCRLDECFDTTGESAWLVNHAAEYGWILRYPQGKQDITGVIYSPWNYRYVGRDMAMKISASGLTMEEYFGE